MLLSTHEELSRFVKGNAMCSMWSVFQLVLAVLMTSLPKVTLGETAHGCVQARLVLDGSEIRYLNSVGTTCCNKGNVCSWNQTDDLTKQVYNRWTGQYLSPLEGIKGRITCGDWNTMKMKTNETDRVIYRCIEGRLIITITIEKAVRHVIPPNRTTGLVIVKPNPQLHENETQVLGFSTRFSIPVLRETKNDTTPQPTGADTMIIITVSAVVFGIVAIIASVGIVCGQRRSRAAKEMPVEAEPAYNLGETYESIDEAAVCSNLDPNLCNQQMNDYQTLNTSEIQSNREQDYLELDSGPM